MLIVVCTSPAGMLIFTYFEKAAKSILEMDLIFK